MNREHPTGTERKSLNYECGWNGGDRGGLAEQKNTKIMERAKETLDRDRPSHGRHFDGRLGSRLAEGEVFREEGYDVFLETCLDTIHVRALVCSERVINRE